MRDHIRVKVVYILGESIKRVKYYGLVRVGLKCKISLSCLWFKAIGKEWSFCLNLER